MLLAGVYFTIAGIAAIGTIIVVLRNKDVFFPKHKK